MGHTVCHISIYKFYHISYSMDQILHSECNNSIVTICLSSLIAFTCINNVGRLHIHFTHYKEDNDVSKADEILQDELIKHTKRPSNTLFLMLMIGKLKVLKSWPIPKYILSMFSFQWIFTINSNILYATIRSKCFSFGNNLIYILESISSCVTFADSPQANCPTNT